MKGKVAFVTGAANGIGRASARLLLAAGVNVVGLDLDGAELEGAAKEFAALEAGQFLPITADLSDHAALPGHFQTALARFGRVDFLINSAGILGGTADFLALGVEEWNRIYHVNLTAPMLLMQEFGHHAMQRGGGGRIVNVTSSSAFRAFHSKPAYGSAKSALGGLTRIVASQFGAYDINVNAVAPGITNTPGAGSKRNVDPAAMLAKVSSGPQQNFFKRVSEATDVADTIVFLCSGASRQITGQTIHVSGGAITL